MYLITIYFHRGKFIMYQRIKEMRENNKIEACYIAKALNVGEDEYLSYERGELDVPLEVAVRMSRFYDVSIDYLAGLSRRKNKEDWRIVLKKEA